MFRKFSFIFGLVLFTLYEILCLQGLSFLYTDIDITTTYTSLVICLLVIFIFIHELDVGNSRNNDTIKLFKIISIFTIFLYFSAVLNGPQNKLLYVSLLLPFLYFRFSVSCQSHVEENHYLNYYSLIVIILILFAFYYVNIRFDVLSQTLGTNSSYIPLLLYPFVLCSKKKWIRIGCSAAIFVLILLSIKRTGLLAFAFGTVLYYLLSAKTSKQKYLNNIIIIGFIAVGGWFLFNYADSFVGNSMSQKFLSMIEGDSSERDILYPIVLKMIQESDNIQLIFGHGWDSVIVNNPMGLSAHNDFLEITYDLGVCGLILYIALCFELIKYAIILLKKSSKYAPAFVASVAIFLMMSMTSHIVIYLYLFLSLLGFWGYVIGQENDKI